MLTLQKRPPEQWKTVVIVPGVEIEVFIRRPEYEQLLAAESATTGTEIISIRLHAIADWRAVVDAQGVAVPFSHDAMADLFHAYPAALGRLLAAVRPMFETEETDRKNSEAPPSAATALSPPSAGSSVSDALPPAPMPSV